MKLLITRPVVLAGDGGTRSFVPGLTVEVDAATAEQILDRSKAGIAAEPAANSRNSSHPRRRSPPMLKLDVTADVAKATEYLSDLAPARPNAAAKA